MKKVKVLFFIYEMGGGGAARTLLNIMNNLDRDRFIPMLATLNFNGAYEEELKPDVHFIKLESKRLRGAVWPLARLIRKHRVDIVFSTIPNVNTIAIAARWLSFTRAKNLIREADNLGGRLSTNVKLWCFGRVYTRAHQIVSLSEGVKANLVKRYRLKPEAIRVIYNPVDLENIREKLRHGTIADKHKPLFAGADKVIMTAGRLVEQKDHQTLLNAFAKVHAHIPSRLIILGEGHLHGALVQQARHLQIGDRVHFLGFQRNPYVYFQRADLFVLSSKHEGFSHVIAEALATGTPVVATDCRSGPAEVLADGEYGLLCEVGNAEDMAEKMLEALTRDDEQAAILRERGRRRAEDFAAPSIVRQYEAALLATLGKK